MFLGSEDSKAEGIPVIELVFDGISRSATLLAGGFLVFVDAAADDFILLGRVVSRFGLLGGLERGGATAGGSCRTSAVVNFGFEGYGFFLDDAEAAFDGVVGGSCKSFSTCRRWRR